MNSYKNMILVFLAFIWITPKAEGNMQLPKNKFEDIRPWPVYSGSLPIWEPNVNWYQPRASNLPDDLQSAFVSQHADTVSGLQSRLASLDGMIQMLATKLDAAQVSFEGTVTRIENTVSGLGSSVSRQGSDITTLQRSVSEHAIKVSGVESRLTFLDGMIQMLATKLDARTSDIVDIGKVPTSCVDQKTIGHKKNGLFLVQGPQFVETVYCDFKKADTQPGFERKIGFVDVKSSPVFFFVQRDVEHLSFQLKTPIKFTKEVVNLGRAMNMDSGKFTAPRKGMYFFSFVGTVRGELQNTVLYKNGAHIGSGLSMGPRDTNVIQSVLELEKNDEVWVEINVGNRLFDDSSIYTHFNGYLLEQRDIFS